MDSKFKPGHAFHIIIIVIALIILYYVYTINKKIERHHRHHYYYHHGQDMHHTQPESAMYQMPSQHDGGQYAMTY